MMNKIDDQEKGKDNSMNKKLISTSTNLSNKLIEEDDEESEVTSCLFFSVTKFQTIFGLSYGLSGLKLVKIEKMFVGFL